MPAEYSEGVAGRYSGEKAKLKAQQALRLKTAMAKLVGNYDHSDIILESSDGRHLPSHLCILKSRAPGFYKCYVEPYQDQHDIDAASNQSTPRGTPIVRIGDVDYGALKFFLRCIYTAEEVPAHPSMCTEAMFTTTGSTSMSSSGYEQTPRDHQGPADYGGESGSDQQPPSDQPPPANLDQSGSTMTGSSNGSSRLATSHDSQHSARTYVLDEVNEESQSATVDSMTSSMHSIPTSRQRFVSPERGTRALTVSAYSSMSDSVVVMTASRNEQPPAAMMTSFAELAAAASTSTLPGATESVTANESPESLALTTSMDSATSDDQYDYDKERGSTLPRRHRTEHTMGKFIRMDGGSSSSEQSPQQQQQQQQNKKIFPMFIEMDSNRPSRLSLCEPEAVPLSVAAVRRSGSGCTIDSPARSSQMGRKRWSVTSLRSLDSADLASPLSSHGSVITGLDEEILDPSADEAGGLQGACSRLGKDLVTMLMEGRDTDLTLLTSGGQLRAHRCILATSCPYFHTMLSGDWLESRNNVIDLSGYSEATITCALRLIYGGVVDVGESVSVWELISFADMIQLEDLKQVAYLHIRGKYCHFFHKPCSGCVNGVLECLPHLHSAGISELLEKCRQWQAKYFARIWKTKMFNMLPEFILDLCYRAVLESMTPHNILDIMLGCEKLQLTLPKSKSAEAAGALVACLTDAALEYLSLHLDSIVESSGFTNLGKGYALNLSLFEDILPSVVHSLSPDTGCRTLVRLFELMTLIASQQQTGEEDWNDRFINLLRRLYELCDTHLIHYASVVVRCDAWSLLTPDMQRRIKETGIFVDIRQPKAPPPRLSSFNRSYKRSSSSADRVRDRSVSIHRFRPPPPLTEHPSKSSLSESPSALKSSPPSSHPGSMDKKKHRQSPPLAAKTVSAPSASVVVRTEKPAMASDTTKDTSIVESKMTRSSTTDLTPGGAALGTADPSTPKPNEALHQVENVIMDAQPAAEPPKDRHETPLEVPSEERPVPTSRPSEAPAPIVESPRRSPRPPVRDENKVPAASNPPPPAQSSDQPASASGQQTLLAPKAKLASSSTTSDSSAIASPKRTASPRRPASPTKATSGGSSLKQPQVVAKTSHPKKPPPEESSTAKTEMHRSPEMANVKEASRVEALSDAASQPPSIKSHEISRSEIKTAAKQSEDPKVDTVGQSGSKVEEGLQPVAKPEAPSSVAQKSPRPVAKGIVEPSIVTQRDPSPKPRASSAKPDESKKTAAVELAAPDPVPSDATVPPPPDQAIQEEIVPPPVDPSDDSRPTSELSTVTTVREAASIESLSAAPSTSGDPIGESLMETDENTLTPKPKPDVPPSTSSTDNKQRGSRTVAAVAPTTNTSTSPKKTVCSTKPTAKVAGIPKTNATSTAPSTPRQPAASSAASTRASRAMGTNKPRPPTTTTAHNQSPMRRSAGGGTKPPTSHRK